MADEDLFRAYIVSYEAWYADLARVEPEIMVQLASRDGGVKWEFGIRLTRIDTLRVEMFAGSWTAFVDCPDLFAALADLDTDAKVGFHEIRVVLDRLGFRDVTERTSPYASNVRRTLGGKFYGDSHG